LSKAFTKVATYETSYKNFVIQEEEAQADVDEYTGGIKNYDKKIEALKEYKTTLTELFESRYRRFIQEGTWNKQESIDDEKYFLEAKSVAYTSAQPQITYTISVISLEGVAGYENFDFELADKTWMEDEEYFGYDEEGNPYREEVVLTEINYVLD
jgi:flagellar capping protein FliD